MLKVGTRVQIIDPRGARGSKVGDTGTIVGLWEDDERLTGYYIRFDADHLRAEHGDSAGLFYYRVKKLKGPLGLVLMPRRKLSLAKQSTDLPTGKVTKLKRKFLTDPNHPL